MKTQEIQERLADFDLKYDEFGRIIIEDEELLEFISGATFDFIGYEDNTACGSNGACGNAGCANVARCK